MESGVYHLLSVVTKWSLVCTICCQWWLRGVWCVPSAVSGDYVESGVYHLLSVVTTWNLVCTICCQWWLRGVWCVPSAVSSDYVESGVYHLLPMCSVYIEVTIKSSASECLWPYFSKFFCSVSNEPQTCCQQHTHTHTHTHTHIYIYSSLNITQIFWFTYLSQNPLNCRVKQHCGLLPHTCLAG